MDLLGSDSDTEDVLNVNNDYAAKYDNWRGKEHLQKLKDKYGDRGDLNENEEDSDSSTDEEEDDDAEELTPEIEKDFFATLSSLKCKDPTIYDGKTNFFTNSSLDKTVSSDSKSKKITIADMERKIMLEKEGKFDDIEESSKKETNGGTTYVEEMKNIKDSFKAAFEDENDSDTEDSLLTKRQKTQEESKQEESDYKKWLAGQETEIKDSSLKNRISGLREYWNDSEKLDEGEKFLKDYLLNKRYLDKDSDDYVPSYDEIVHDSDEDLSEDEKNVAKQEEFEHKFNFRFEEPDEDFIKRYPRTIKDSLRRDDDKRKKKRKEVEDRKKHEKEMKKEEIKMLKSMKKREIMEKLEKLKKITGNDDMEMDEDDIEGDFDPEKYDKKMAEIFQNYDDNIEVDGEKPTFSDFEDDFDDNYGDDFEDWDNWNGGNVQVDSEGQDETEPHCEDEDFNMDCDFQQEMVESTKKKKGRRKSKFAQAVEKDDDRPVFDPSDKTFTEYVDEYYKLDCEDLIGDLPCRFQYRSVQPNDFGLSVEEVLGAEDKELNAWVSLRKTCQYRNEEDERKDFHVFRNKSKDVKLKKKLMPSLFEEDEAKPTETNKSEADATVKTDEVEKITVGRKRKRKNKNKQNSTVQTEVKKIKLEEKAGGTENADKKEENKIVNTPEASKKKKKKRKKKTNVPPTPTNAVIQVQKIAAAYQEKNKQQGQKGWDRNKNKKNASQSNKQKGDDLVKMSDERLKAYGVNPNQLKRKLKSEKFRNK